MPWTNNLGRFFEDREKQLGGVLAASSCREGWLHGEMFRHLHQDNLRVNEVKIGERKTADIACGEPPSMVGEVKVLGTGYQAKVITGVHRGLSKVVQRLDRPISHRDHGTYHGAGLLGTWGLIPDYFRLRYANLDATCERLLVLVADVKKDADDDLSRVLRTIQFEASAHRKFRLRRVLVRTWTLWLRALPRT